jgi:Flp pilus assembly CpaF family ATPase
LIGDEVARWNDDHRRGRRAFALPDPELVVERAFRNLARYGPLTPLLADDDVWEIMVGQLEPFSVSPGLRATTLLSRPSPHQGR